METYEFETGSFVAKQVDSCINFTFNNIEAVSAKGPEWAWEYLGHKLIGLMKSAGLPDDFYVIPAPGWEVVTPNPVTVAEWAQGVITVCQMAMS